MRASSAGLRPPATGLVAETIFRMDSLAAAEASDTENGEAVNGLLRRSDRLLPGSGLLIGNRILDGSGISFGRWKAPYFLNIRLNPPKKPVLCSAGSAAPTPEPGLIS